MTIARQTASWLSAVTITNGSTTTATEQDLLGNNTSCAINLALWLEYTCTVAAGSIDVSVWFDRLTGTNDSDQAPVIFSVVPINGTQKILLGGPYNPIPAPTRFVNLSVANNGIGASLTALTLAGEYTQVS